MDPENQNTSDGMSEILRFKMRKEQEQGKEPKKKIEESLSFENLKFVMKEEKKIHHIENTKTVNKTISKAASKSKEENKENAASTDPLEIKRKKNEKEMFFIDKKDKKKVKIEMIADGPSVTVPKLITEKYHVKIGCKFCDIIHITKTKLIYEDEECAAFHDKRKCSAQEHILICPKKHILNTAHLVKDDIPLLRHLEEVGKKILKEKKPNGSFRFGYHQPPMNSVEHLHLHAFLLPLTNDFLDKTIYGLKMASTQKIIELVSNGIPAGNGKVDLKKVIDLEDESSRGEEIVCEKIEKIVVSAQKINGKDVIDLTDE